MPFLNQRKGENDRRKYFMINLHEIMDDFDFESDQTIITLTLIPKQLTVKILMGVHSMASVNEQPSDSVVISLLN